MIASGTEVTLARDTVNGIYVFTLGASGMTGGDFTEARVKTIQASGATLGDAYYAAYGGIQGQPNKYSVPIFSPIEVAVTLKQAAAAATVTYPWSLLRM